MRALHNRVNRNILKERLMQESFKRITVSFYRYVIINNPQEFRDKLYLDFEDLGIFGRVYIAYEGINAQISLPEHNWDAFKKYLDHTKELENIPLKIAVEDNGKSFYKLDVKVRKKIVADGLDDKSFDVTNVGKHLSAAEFNDALENPNTVLIDMRNHYESEVGRFDNAICPNADTFKEELPIVMDILKGKEDKKVLLYCTGGVRCEKASAYLKHHGFKDVNQLHGGIIEYARQVKQFGLPSKFKGKNFVFDQRLGERITDDILSTCHQCGKACDNHTNCANDECHLLFIQCDECKAKYKGCCTPQCMKIIELPIEEQIRLRKGKTKENTHGKSRLRPNLKKFLLENFEFRFDKNASE